MDARWVAGLRVFEAVIRETKTSDQDVCEERVTRIELAFSAWEAAREGQSTRS